MNENETASNLANGKTSIPSHLRYQPVRDGRKRKIRGLWIRNGNFYARLTVEENGQKKVVRKLLEGVSTVAEAVAALNRLKIQRADNTLPVMGQTPKLKDYVDTYFKEMAPNAKSPLTIQKERGCLKLWIEHMGETRLHKITKSHIKTFRTKRLKGEIGKTKATGRTVNLDVIMLNNVLKSAREDDIIKGRLASQDLKAIPHRTEKGAFVQWPEIQRICDASLEVCKNGQEFSDYIKLMCFLGSRRNETLRIKWSDVNWQMKQVNVGSDGSAKYDKKKYVDFNPKLEAHLVDMQTRRAPDSQWLFPSPQRGKTDKPVKTFRGTLESVREHLATKENFQTGFTFHDCRDCFISYCVMTGIDFMTIAEWVGHVDGGVLIGKVYGHLAPGHKAEQAKRLNFEPVVLQKTA